MDKKTARRLLVVLLSLVVVMTVFTNLVVGAEKENSLMPASTPQPNHVITAVNDVGLIVMAGESITIDVLANDTVTPSSHDSLKIQGFETQGQYGNATITTEGRRVLYTADAVTDATEDCFEYRVGVGNSPHNTVTAWVYITIIPRSGPQPNQDPVAYPFNSNTPFNQSISIHIIDDIGCSDPDGDSITVQSLGTPGSGTVSHDNALTITYTPNNGFHGPDSFTYTISDSKNAIHSATITIVVGQPPLPEYRPLKPVLESVNYHQLDNGEHAWEAHWGWLNENADAVEALVSKFTGTAVGATNCPTTFAPGRQRNMFTTIFTSVNLVWTLKGPDGSQRTATAGRTPIPTTGHLTVQKQLQGGGDNEAEFRITVRRVSMATAFNQEEPIYISVNQSWQRDLLPGTYQVTEDDMPEGYYFEDISPEDGLVTIVAGEEYTVTIVNRYEPEPETGTLVIRKQINGSGYSPNARFLVTIEPYGEIIPMALQEAQPVHISVNEPWSGELEPGTYLIREVEQPSSRYSLVGISNEGIVEIVADTTSEVIVINSYRAPAPPPDPEPEPEIPEQPTTPDEPTKPEEPVGPEEPIDPEEPEEPIEPEEPTEPEQPDPGILPKTSSIDAALVLGSILTLGGLWLSRKQR